MFYLVIATECIRYFITSGQKEQPCLILILTFCLGYPFLTTIIRNKAALVAVEIILIDVAPSPSTKKKGVVIRSLSKLNEICPLFTNQKLVELRLGIDDVNPTRLVPKV